LPANLQKLVDRQKLSTFGKLNINYEEYYHFCIDLEELQKIAEASLGNLIERA